MSDLYCLGEPLVEFNQQTGDTYLRGFGGDVSNVAIAASRQGAQAAMLTNIGKDQFGADLRALWQSEGVSDVHVNATSTGDTGLYFVTHDDQGHHFTYRRRGSAASHYAVHDLPKTNLSSAKIFYASGISLAISQSMHDAVAEGFDTVHRSGGLRAFDPNLRTALWPLEQAREVTHAMMRQCDIALPGYDDACQLTQLSDPKDIIAYYHDLGASIVALTLGHKGVIVSAGNERHTIEAMTVDALDATGAGDCFNGAFLAALLRELSPFEAGHWANAAAALSTCGYGAVAPIPSLCETKTYLEK